MISFMCSHCFSYLVLYSFFIDRNSLKSSFFLISDNRCQENDLWPVYRCYWQFRSCYWGMFPKLSFEPPWKVAITSYFKNLLFPFPLPYLYYWTVLLRRVGKEIAIVSVINRRQRVWPGHTLQHGDLVSLVIEGSEGWRPLLSVQDARFRSGTIRKDLPVGRTHASLYWTQGFLQSLEFLKILGESLKTRD